MKQDFFSLPKEIENVADEVLIKYTEQFKRIDEISEYNQLKVSKTESAKLIFTEQQATDMMTGEEMRLMPFFPI